MRRNRIISVLEGPGRTGEISSTVASLVQEDPALFSELMFGLWHVEGSVRSQAADAIEKITRDQPTLLQPFKKELLGLAEEARPAAVRWHLAQMLPRLKLTRSDRERAISLLQAYLTDRSSIVKTLAMDSLVKLARNDEEATWTILELMKTGTPAMQARGRKLLREMQRS